MARPSLRAATSESIQFLRRQLSRRHPAFQHRHARLQSQSRFDVAAGKAIQCSGAAGSVGLGKYGQGRIVKPSIGNRHESNYGWACPWRVGLYSLRSPSRCASRPFG